MPNRDLDEWVRLDVNFFHNPKVRRAGSDGQLLWISGLLYSKRTGTDGAIEADMLDLLGFEAGLTPEAAAHAADRLVTTGMWERTADGWQVHDFSKCQETRAEVEARREAWRNRSKRARAKQLGKSSPASDESSPTSSPDVTGDSPVSHARVTGPDKTRQDIDIETPSSSLRARDAKNASDGRPDDDEQRISRTIRQLAVRTHEHEYEAGKVKNKRAHLRTCIANAYEDHAESVEAFFELHPTATVGDALEHLDPRDQPPPSNGAPMSGTKWTVHATYDDPTVGFVAMPAIVCADQADAERRAAAERTQLIASGKSGVDVLVSPPTAATP